MARVQWKGSVLTAPVPPVLVSCRCDGADNVLTVAWTGTVCTNPPKTYISLRPERHSYQMIRKSGVFVINLTTRALIRAADWCGVNSGARCDKFAAMSLAREESDTIDCPRLAASPLALECRVSDVIPLGTHDMLLADIVSVSVDASLLDENGRLCMERADLAAYAHGTYYTLGKAAGTFGFSVKKKKHHK